jgi:ketosteroid isomerase-like protein
MTPSEAAIEYINAYNAHDLDRLRRGYHEDFTVENPLWEGTKSVDEVIATFGRVWSALPGARMELYNLAVDGDTALLEFTFAWDDPRDGTTKRTPVADVFTVKDGLLANLRAYMDAGLFHGWLDEMGA